VDGEPPAAVLPPALVPVCSDAIITPAFWSEREVGPGGAGFGAGFALVHWSESLVAFLTWNSLRLEVPAELVPGAELGEASDPVAVVLLPELISAELAELVLPVAEPSIPVT
jgi:hypothetical protein